MYPLALGFTKISLLSLYKRIFSISRRTRVIIVTTIALVIAWMIALFFAELFQCNTKFWANWGSAHDIRTQCNRTTMIIFAVCLTDSIFDLTILVMPIPLVCPDVSNHADLETDTLEDLATQPIDSKENRSSFNLPAGSRVRVKLLINIGLSTNGSQHGHSISGPLRARRPARLLAL